MLDIVAIKQAYPDSLHRYERGLLREYLQYQILSIIFGHRLSRKLSFLGGTCLRIVHNLPRFSEDIDFDNKDLTESEFVQLGEYLGQELRKRGYGVEIVFTSKAAIRCKIKFPELLFSQGLSPQRQEKILISVDTFDQGVVYKPEVFILNKFEFFQQILTTPKSVLLSQKLWTLTQRPRLKGRDFFDVMFLLQSTKPDQDFLRAKFGVGDLDKVRKEILGGLKGVEYSDLASDVRPFLQNPEDADKIKLFPQFLMQELES